MRFWHKFQPYRLPNPALRGIPNPTPFIALFSARTAVSRAFVFANDLYFVFAYADERGNIQRERRKTALMHADFVFADKYCTFAIHRTKMQGYASAYLLLRQREITLINKRLSALQAESSADTAIERFRRKGYEYFALKKGSFAVRFFYRPFPV